MGMLGMIGKRMLGDVEGVVGIIWEEGKCREGCEGVGEFEIKMGKIVRGYKVVRGFVFGWVDNREWG